MPVSTPIIYRPASPVIFLPVCPMSYSGFDADVFRICIFCARPGGEFSDSLSIVVPIFTPFDHRFLVGVSRDVLSRFYR